MKFCEGICKEKVSVYSVPFVDASGCSIRKYKLFKYTIKHEQPIMQCINLTN